MTLLCEAAQAVGFQFKLKKCQFNQDKIVLWGIICDKHGKSVEPKKVEQLENWPEPKKVADVNSFLAFVNYLRANMMPEWLEHEQVLKPFRKKGCDFKIWYTHGKYKHSFEQIRGMLAKNLTLAHADFEKAADLESGCPL